MKVVSIVIPVHNRADLLRECLQSVARQTYPHIEVIVVDDASAEAIQPVIDAISWPDTFQTTYIRADTNGGPGAARELGRQAVTGDYVCYLDSDDLYHEEKIARQVEQLENHPDAGMCYTASLYFDQRPIIPTGDEPLRPGGDREISHFLPFLLLNRHRVRPWATASCMWTASSVAKIGPWYTSWYWEDLFYDIKAGSQGIMITYIPDALTYIYRGPDVRLTNENKCNSRVHQAAVLLAITAYLDSCGVFKDRIYRMAAQWFLFDHGLMLLRCEETTEAVKCFRRMLSLSHTSIPTLYAIFMSVLVRIMAPSRAASWGRFFRYKPVGAWGKIKKMGGKVPATISSEILQITSI